MKEKISLPYKLVKAYFRLLINGFYYRRYYSIDVDNIPEDGTPMLMVSDHQNCLNDALGVLLAVNDRKMRFIARADAFTITPPFTKFILWVGLRPAFRMMYQGEEQLSRNQETFRLTEKDLLDGHSILLYPEAGHQTGHWLGFFSQGYLRMGFEAAEHANFEKEIFILPSCNHYSKYHGIRNDMLVRFGKPVSLKPYYELYKTHPRTAWRQVNEEVKARICELMLDIRDKDHYHEIDYLRESAFGQDFARSMGKNPALLPEKLDADKELVARIDAHDVPFEEVREVRETLQSLGLEDRQFEKKPGVPGVIGQALLLLLTLPLAVVAIWPSLPCWYVPKYFADKMEDNMFEGTFVLPIDVLLIIPLGFLATVLVGWHWLGPWALLHGLALPFLCVFEWYWTRLALRLRADFRYLKAGKRAAALKEKRAALFTKLKNIL